MESQAIDDTMLVCYLDGELDPVTARLVEEQFDANPAVRERMAMFRATDELLRAALATPEPSEVSPVLQARIARLLAPPRRLLNRRVWIPLAAVAAMVILVLGGGHLVRQSPPDDNATTMVAHVLEEVADYHGVYAYETEHLVEVPASRQEHLESWLGARVKLPFNVPNLQAYDLAFRGARLLAIDRQPVAQLMYTGKDGAAVALCIALTATDASSSLVRREDDGLKLFGKGAGHHVFVVVGPSGNNALQPIAEAIQGLLQRG